MTRKVSPKKIIALKQQLEEEILVRDEEICRLYAGYLEDRATGWTLEKIAEKHMLTKSAFGRSGKGITPTKTEEPPFGGSPWWFPEFCK